MLDENRLRDMQKYIARVAITPSAVRNLKATGLVAEAQKFLGALDLNVLRSANSEEYLAWLDQQTTELEEKFQSDGNRAQMLWGPARKCLNIFMTMACLNRYLCAAYALNRLEKVLELPLDNLAAKHLLDWARNKGKHTKWTTIKGLQKEDSEKFQKLALQMAKEKGIPRGRLDVILWREEL